MAPIVFSLDTQPRDFVIASKSSSFLNVTFILLPFLYFYLPTRKSTKKNRWGIIPSPRIGNLLLKFRIFSFPHRGSPPFRFSHSYENKNRKILAVEVLVPVEILERREKREVVLIFWNFSLWKTSSERLWKIFVFCAKRFHFFAFGEFLEKLICGKEKFGDIFGENFPLLIICAKICWNFQNNFQFFCVKKKQIGNGFLIEKNR